jgi:hypothetical protein
MSPHSIGRERKRAIYMKRETAVKINLNRAATVMLMLAIMASMVGCGSGDGKGMPSGDTDYVRVKSVSPDSGLIDNTATTFAVIVEYSLVSHDEGELKVGFNNLSDELAAERGCLASNMILDEAVIVTRGSGENLFNVTATTKDWQKEECPFRVMATLSEYPHGPKYSPLDSDYYVLQFD